MQWGAIYSEIKVRGTCQSDFNPESIIFCVTLPGELS